MGDKKCICEMENLEQNDNLYKMIDFDGGFGFDIIFDIKYCPVCGKLLPEEQEA